MLNSLLIFDRTYEDIQDKKSKQRKNQKSSSKKKNQKENMATRKSKNEEYNQKRINIV